MNKAIVLHSVWYDEILNVGINNIHSYFILALYVHTPVLGLLINYF